MKFTRIDNGHHCCENTDVEYMSTWRFGKNYGSDFNDLDVLNAANDSDIQHFKKCPIEFEKAREIYGDYVYMYPVEWLKSKYMSSNTTI